MAAGRKLFGLSPSISSDGRLMAFIAWRSSPSQFPPGDTEYPGLLNYGGSDVYVSERVGNEWQAVRNAGELINRGDVSTVVFTPGSYSLYLWMKEDATAPLGLFISEFRDGTWDSPRRLSLNFPANRLPPHRSISSCGQNPPRVYFSDFVGGPYARRDIWIASQTVDAWSQPFKLSREVNSRDGFEADRTSSADRSIVYFDRITRRNWRIWATGLADKPEAIQHIAHIYANSDLQLPP